LPLSEQEKMSETEVTLRLAFYLIERKLTASDVKVAIDGAQVKTSNNIHFTIAAFMRDFGWIKPVIDDRWQGTYVSSRHHPKIFIHSTPGCGDLMAELIDGRTLRVECKKGPLVRSKSSQEYPLLREALGQLLTLERVGEQDLLAVAVPCSPKFNDLAQRWRQAPLVSRFGICILTVGRDNLVRGLPEVTASNERVKQIMK